ncbi:MAG: monovalent cation/H+ antiporter complex subunit F [Bacteroidales bacterium]|jgi:multicomponent Na+:H+ antiporter subunit F|nr:monovalent cation/H+ antiporter complex subunit F [Bacteroidales bacterium]
MGEIAEVPLVGMASQAAIWLMTLSLVFPLYRLFRGPGLTDRVVALDQIGMIVTGIVICDAIFSNDTMLLDVILIISFMFVFGPIIIAHYLHKKQTEK